MYTRFQRSEGARQIVTTAVSTRVALVDDLIGTEYAFGQRCFSCLSHDFDKEPVEARWTPYGLEI